MHYSNLPAPKNIWRILDKYKDVTLHCKMKGGQRGGGEKKNYSRNIHGQVYEIYLLNQNIKQHNPLMFAVTKTYRTKLLSTPAILQILQAICVCLATENTKQIVIRAE